MTSDNKNIQLGNRYYLMRHGESIANLKGIIVSHPENALGGYGLTTNGAEQISNAARQILNATAQPQLDRNTIIVSSDYKRTRETAEIMAKLLEVQAPLEFDALLRERNFGDWELSAHENYESVWHHDFKHHEKANNRVEATSDVIIRFQQVIKSLEQRYSGKRILVVGHGDVLQIALAHYSNLAAHLHRSITHLANAEVRPLIE